MKNLLQLILNEDGTLSFFTDEPAPFSDELATKVFPYLKTMIPNLRRRLPPYSGPNRRLAEALLDWRRNQARALDVPAYFILHQHVIYAIADKAPQTEGELKNIPGFGPLLFDKYGMDILKMTAELCPSSEL